MTLEFTKMNGAGNDFILIDNRSKLITLRPEQIVRLCDRQRGIGADGLFLLVPCDSGAADWAWEFYNRDGSSADMCGNGARCFGRFVQRLTRPVGDVTFLTGAGVIRATFAGDHVTVNLTRPRDLKLNQPIAAGDGTMLIHSLNTGVPHAVVFVPNADQAMVSASGAELRNHRQFAPDGTNVNFVQVMGNRLIRVRTYERGVEGETLACGTGVAAAALIASRVHGFAPPIEVQVRGGDRLKVDFREEDGGFAAVRLTGPADFVFEGRIEI